MKRTKASATIHFLLIFSQIFSNTFLISTGFTDQNSHYEVDARWYQYQKSPIQTLASHNSFYSGPACGKAPGPIRNPGPVDLAIVLNQAVKGSTSIVNPSCGDTSQSVTSSSLIAEFIKDSDQLLTHDAYKKIDLNGISSILQEVPKRIEKLLEDQALTQYEHQSGKKAEHLKHLLKEAADLTLLEGLFGIVGSTTGHAIAKAGKITGVNQQLTRVAKKLAHSTKNKIGQRHSESEQHFLEDLLPSDSGKKIAFIRGATGLIMVSAGAISMVGAAQGWGVPIGVIGNAAEIGGHIGEHAVNQSNTQKNILHTLVNRASEALPPGELKVHSKEVNKSSLEASSEQSTHLPLEIKYHSLHANVDSQVSAIESGQGSANEAVSTANETSNIGTDAGAHTAHAAHDPIQAAALETAAIGIPVVGGFYLIVKGSKKIYEAIKGPEQRKELLRLYTDFYHEIVSSLSNSKVHQIEDLLMKSQLLLRDQALSDFERDQINFQIHSLCEALDWLNQFRQFADRKFQERTLYLDEKILMKKDKREALDEIKTLVGQGNKAKENKNLKKNIDLFSDYRQQLRSQQRQLGGLQANPLSSSGTSSPDGENSNAELKSRLRSIVEMKLDIDHAKPTSDPRVLQTQESSLKKINAALQKQRETQEGRSLLQELEEEFEVEGKKVQLLAPEKKSRVSLGRMLSYLSPEKTAKKVFEKYDDAVERKQVSNHQTQSQWVSRLHQEKDLTQKQEAENLNLFRQAFMERGKGFIQWYKDSHSKSLSEEDKNLSDHQFIHKLLKPLEDEYATHNWPNLTRLKDGTVPARTAKHLTRERVQKRTQLQNELLNLIQQYDLPK